jgi:hypothetical protein
MSEIKRNKDSRYYEDSHTIDNLEYNRHAGGRKVLEVGPVLEYLGTAFGGIQVEKGDSLHILNLSGATGYIAISDSAPGVPAAPGPGIFPVIDGSTTGVVQKYSVGANTFIRTSAATLHVYRIIDDTIVRTNP